MTSKLLKQVSQQDAIEKAWRVIQENARGSTSDLVREEVDGFAEEAGRRTRSISWHLSRNRFDFGKAKGIPIPKRDGSGRKTGKFRPIVLASVESRIVQRSILEVLVGLPTISDYVNTPHSFGGIRRTRDPEFQDRKDNPSAVPAAIKAVLDAIKAGARFYACADIKSFFTRISKPHVTRIVGAAVNDDEFLALFEKAIVTELSNMAELREKAADFPIQEIGVAQGNSLSPLLGNIALAEFDREMNERDCVCIRYIDDFIILAPTAKAANARLRKATSLLAKLGMELSPDKSSRGATPVENGIAFLGVEVKPGIIRPGIKSQSKFIRSISDEFDKTRTAFAGVKHGKPLARSQTLISTMKRVEGIVEGWGKHYWFCNDSHLLSRIDSKVKDLVRDFLGAYRDLRSKLPGDKQHLLLGIPALSDQKRRPFQYPKSVAVRTDEQDRDDIR